MSWVFLTGLYAWKIKKCMCSDSFLDFSSLERREYYCREELRLNRRLAPDIYLDVVPLRKNAQGRFSVGGREGEIIEWILKMKQLPADTTLRCKMERGSLTVRDIDAIATRLTGFFAEAESVEVSTKDYVGSFEEGINYNFSRLLEQDCNAWEMQEHEDLRDRQISFLSRGEALLAQRVQDGKIVEGHGDLRPEHIYLLAPEPAIIDCIEFNRDLRVQDPADEFSFLQMMCASFGDEGAGKRIFEIYRRKTGDRPHEALVAFYAGFRAATRARLALRHMQDLPDADPVKWSRKLQKFLDLALMYAERQEKNL